VFLDRADGAGVDLATIAAASEAVSPVLDADPAVEQALPGPYNLEVSSPGLERTLRTPAHFLWAVGRPVSVKTRSDDGGLRRRGVVVAADDTGVDFDFDGSSERLPYDQIVQARTVFEWGAPPAPERKRRRKHATKKQEVAQ
jgi:ribosome maturation factor RimP